MAATLSSLLGQTSITDHDQVLSAADATLAKSAGDVQAQHVKIVALLNLDRFQDAIKAVEAGGNDVKQRARLEYAYALYKAGQPGKAAEVARQEVTESDRGLRHVEAQASYRHQDFERAAELYRQLSAQRGAVTNEDMDLRINTGATHAQLEWSGRATAAQPQKPTREDMDAFETAYNAACNSIARDELGQAEVLLKRSKELCDASEMTEEEKDAEIVPITIQQLYVLIRQGKIEEAQRLAATIDAKDVQDSSTQFIAQTNKSAVSSEATNPYLTHRLLYKSPQSILPDKPFTYQSAAIQRNNCTLDLLAHKYDGIIRSTASLVTDAPTLDSNVNSLTAFGAAAHARNQAGKDALKILLPVLDRRPNDIGLLLVVTQLYVLLNNHGAAISLIEAFNTRLSKSTNTSDADVRHVPGLVATLVSLYSARGQNSHARAELGRAAKYWRNRSNAPISTRALTHLYKSAGAALLESNHAQDQALAADIFSFLHDQDADDRYATAGLIAALARANPDKIESSHLSALTPVDRLIAAVNTSALESAGVPKAPTSATTTPSTKRPAPTSEPVRKPKKLKPSKTPKDYDPAKKMDAERWLPLKDRSYYRPKGKKAKARQAMFMQGGVVDEGASQGSSRAGTPGPGTVEAKGGVVGGQQQQKKKKGKKGGKW